MGHFLEDLLRRSTSTRVLLLAARTKVFGGREMAYGDELPSPVAGFPYLEGEVIFLARLRALSHL